MTKLLFVLLMLFSMNVYSLTEAECLDRATFISVIGFEFRDQKIPLEKTKAIVSKSLLEGGIPPDMVKKQAIPLVEWVYSKENKGKPTEVFAQDWFDNCLKVNNGSRLPGTIREEGWKNRTNLPG